MRESTSKKRLAFGVLAGALALSFVGGAVAAPLLTADDFLPIVQALDEQRAELAVVKAPEAVKVEEDPLFGSAVRAATTQDAINRIIQNQSEGGSEVFVLPSGGYGLVATGIGSYDKDMKNVTAQRIAQRNAYVEAFMRAKAAMAASLSEATTKGQTLIEQNTATVNTADLPLANVEMSVQERLSACVSAALKGYVVYNVQDRFDEGVVSVTIVSTPKTRGQYGRPASDTLTAENLNDGVNAMLAEIQNGLVPPVGGRIVSVPATGEIAFVGFGSAVIQHNEQTVMRQRLTQTAGNIAELRASDALNSIITGEQVRRSETLDSDTQSMMKEFETIEKQDPATGVRTAEDVALADGLKTGFRNKEEYREVLASCRQGVLPPGVIRRKWSDAEKGFAWAIAVYYPPATNAAAGAAKEMRDAQIVQPVEPGKSGSSKQPTPELEPGVTGTVNQDL